MVAPFRLRAAPKASFFKTVMSKLEIPHHSPQMAEVELQNYLASLSTYRDISEDRISEIFARCRLAAEEKSQCQARAIRQVVVYMMADDRLTAEERGDLARFVKGIGLDPVVGKSVCCAVGREIYFDRLAKARHDGVICDDERKRLEGIRATFGLSVDVPAAGIDYEQANTILGQSILLAGERIRGRIGGWWQDISSMRARNSVIAEHYHYRMVLGTLSRWLDIANDATNTASGPGSDADAHALLLDTQAQIRSLEAEMDRSIMGQDVALIMTWRRMTMNQVLKANEAQIRSAEQQRQERCRTTAENSGFQVVKGSAASRAWAYCVIVEDCMPLPEWTALVQAAPADAKEAAFKEWLFIQPATFWIDDFASGGFATARTAFAAAQHAPKRRRAKPTLTADFNLDIS